MKKLFVFDCDGTIVNDERKLLPETISVLKKASSLGHEVAICTGRGMSQLTEYLKDLDFIKVVATVNGGIINYLRENKTKLNGSRLGQDIISSMVDLAKKLKRELQWTTIDQKLYRVYFGTTPESDIQDKSFFKIGTMSPMYDNWEEVKHTLQSEEIVHLAVKVENSIINEPFEKIYNEYYLTKKYNVVQTGGVYIDVDPYGVDKASAVKLMQEYLDIKNENTYCFGDSDNDISMVKYAGCGVCLGHGTKKLKYNADVIIGTNNEPAIAAFVTKVISQANATKEIEPSLLAFDINNIDNQLNDLIPIDINFIHYDVMDGYVNNKSFDNEWLELINKKGFQTTIHFMVYKPMQWFERFIKFEPFAITFQYEPLSFAEVMKCIKYLKSKFIKAGIAIKPGSKIEEYSIYLAYVDFVTIMTVEPGKGGQQFNLDALENLVNVYNFRENNDLNYKIEVDGGIKINNFNQVKSYADYIVSGTGFMGLEKMERIEFIKRVRN